MSRFLGGATTMHPMLRRESKAVCRRQEMRDCFQIGIECGFLDSPDQVVVAMDSLYMPPAQSSLTPPKRFEFLFRWPTAQPDLRRKDSWHATRQVSLGLAGSSSCTLLQDVPMPKQRSRTSLPFVQL